MECRAVAMACVWVLTLEMDTVGQLGPDIGFMQRETSACALQVMSNRYVDPAVQSFGLCAERDKVTRWSSRR